MNWKKYKEEKPPEGEEVLAYHPSWIDEDFNPRGIRIGFWNGGDDFKSAHWWDYQDCYITISHCDCDDNSLFSDRMKNSIKPKDTPTLTMSFSLTEEDLSGNNGRGRGVVGGSRSCEASTP